MSAMLALAERLADLPMREEDERKANYIIGQALDAHRHAKSFGALELAAADLIHRYTR